MATMIICDVFVHELQKIYKQDQDNYIIFHMPKLFNEKTKHGKIGIRHRKDRIHQGTRFILEELKRWNL